MSKDKIARLQKEIVNNNLDGFIIPSNDQFFSEYTQIHNNRLLYITGFTGSNGIALILQDQVIFFTDGRYLAQAKLELGQTVQIIDINVTNIHKWLIQNNKQNLKIGLDPTLHNEKFVKTLDYVIAKNLVDLIWNDRPEMPISKIIDYPIKYSGVDAKCKIDQLMGFLDQNNLDYILIADSASICWLLNIRGIDADYTPIINCYLLAGKDNILKLFTNSIDDIKIAQKFQFEKIEDQLILPNLKIAIDKNNTPYKFTKLLEDGQADIIDIKNPCLIWKSCRNQVEIANIKHAHILDGLAICRFLFWFEENKFQSTELSLIKKLEEFRKLEAEYLTPSFATICGFNSNGAIIHYRADEKSNKQITGGLLLIDSGAQYMFGTTDVTRTIATSEPTDIQKENFTRVLKGHIAIACGKFPINTTGNQLDSLARYHLWQTGLDYAHSTGHGVGCYLNVHEGPQYIGKKHSDQPLAQGMIISNEPGYYEVGQYGIRIENLLYVKNSSYHSFLEFEDLTMVPIDYKLIDFEMLNSFELKWLVKYHQKIYQNLAKLDLKLKKWLEKYVQIYSKY